MTDNTHDETPRLEPIPYATPERPHRRTRPLAWISLGILVLISAVLTSSDLTNGRKWRITSSRVKSASNLRQIGQGLILYGNENGVYPPDFGTLMVSEELTADVFVNPAGNDTPAPGATTAAQGQSLTAKPGHCSYVFTAPSAATQPTNPNRIDAYEIPASSVGVNFLFGDTHVEWITNPEARRLIAELKAGHNPPRPAQAAPASK